VERYGDNIEVVRLNYITDTTESLMNFKFRDEKNNKKDFILNSPKDYVVLYFWGAWCSGCHVQAPAFVKLMGDNEDIADYHTFNAGDKEEVMINYISLKKMPFKPWTINNAVVESLQIYAFPTYLVVDNRGKIVLRTSSVGDLNQFFLNANKKTAH
jgi:thiol-disulfide isomerase/thioredoxin